MKNNEINYFDNEEEELINSVKRGEWKSISNKKNIQNYIEHAKYSLNKNKRINIRMNERDLKKIQIKAIQEGLPYQSLISMLIHKYNEGKVKVI